MRTPDPVPAKVEAADAAPPGMVAEPVLEARYLEVFAQEAWYGVYFADKKVGHVHRYARRDGAGDDAPWLIGFELLMRFEAGSRANELHNKELRYYAATAPYRLVRTEFEQRGMQFDEVRSAVLNAAGEMVITRVVGSAPAVEKTVPGTRETLGGHLLSAPLDRSAMPPAEGARVYIWSWEQERDELATITPVGVETVTRAGVVTETMTLRVAMPSVGLPMDVTVATGGLTLATTLGPSLVMKLEERDIAETGISGLDVIGVSLKSPRPLGSPMQLKQLEFILELGADVVIPEGPGQVAEIIDGDSRRVKVLRDAAGGLKADPESIRVALLADATMDSDHPDIVAKAKELTAGLDSASAKVDAIGAWVFRALDKKLATHLPAASVILETKVGDCTEHTWLTVALLRAVGIPARPVYGVAYTGDSEAVFAYHAWVEVALDGEWIAIDPTWGEKRADAGHLKFGGEPGHVAAFLNILTIKAVTPR